MMKSAFIYDLNQNAATVIFISFFYFIIFFLLAQECVDAHDYCGTWNGYGLCENSYFRNMLKTFYCKKTCKACWCKYYLLG